MHGLSGNVPPTTVLRQSWRVYADKDGGDGTSARQGDVRGSASKWPQLARRRPRSLGKDDHAPARFETLSGIANDRTRIVVADVICRPDGSGKNHVVSARSVHNAVSIFDMRQNRHDVD